MSLNQICDSKNQFNQELNLKSIKLSGGNSLNNYEEFSITINAVGFTVPQVCTLEITKVGKSVSYEISGFSGTVNAPVLLDYLLPVRFRPGNELRIPICVVNNGTSQFGCIQILNTGEVLFRKDSSISDFDAGTGSIRATGFSYSV